ncbi:hypothetical protein [Halothece sp. PCC 7418]|uniref:hypothetical protein n=1 Tax=Halothece sp. (strain PCC 7418) TaxID=65093 RepID=UPI0002EF76BF|nr:hypothetical protein [Halothece sp. PCC 7418]
MTEALEMGHNRANPVPSNYVLGKFCQLTVAIASKCAIAPSSQDLITAIATIHSVTSHK